MAALTNQSRLVLRMRLLGQRSGATRKGDSAWGYSMLSKRHARARWKPWQKPLYDMTTFPFKLKPEYRD